MLKEILNRDYIENFIKYHKKAIVKACAGILFFAAAFFVFCIRGEDDQTTKFELAESNAPVIKNQTEEDETETDSAQDEQEQDQDSVIFVDIGGAVEKPYVYEMPSGSRVFEGIQKAGGMTEDADTSTLNLAQVLQDQDKVVVPTKSDVQSNSSKTNNTGIIRGSTGISNGNEYAVTGNNNDNRININTATSEELQTLSGIGPATAEKIIVYRQEQGKFEKIEDITKVSGIGEKTFQKFKTKIMV
ncbi:helix-hairpin-helix domain-containing protein [Clostridium aminobutyricum]|uniref:Helix-hairpin-helix domain-containing protein n=1 Tax=Clostridium aminobutyricum TaxID=33953 RepID=A0A939D8A4_CLOAM|nr:helix-hairpin-helix domain-containing protein [Clostridium aminobutyricum]MBN7772548.1 helix-hairpin-helix domain-containing protein [Clostridium aminobutyricum]